MNIDVLAAAELPDDLTERWSQLQLRCDRLASPYFRPEFTQAVGEARRDAFVAVLNEGDRACGFFPFQRRWSIGRPIGGRLSDHHGVIAPDDLHCNAEELLRACRLSVWNFDHLAAYQQSFAAHHETLDQSPIIDLSAANAAAMSRSGRIKSLCKQMQRLERDHGPLRLELHCPLPSVFDQIASWKSSQYKATGLIDVMSLPWVRAVLQRVVRTNTPDFSGMVTALYVGDQLIAGHIGMRSRRVWHWWFPAYDSTWATHSPGMILLYLAVQAAPELGIEVIDLGKGDAPYKRHFQNASIPLAEGRVERRSVTSSLLRCRRNAEQWIRRTPLLRAARLPGRLLKRAERAAAFR